jgi:hypothetical protein
MWYLCVFFHRYLDYRKPEVESLAQLFGAFKDNQNDVVHPQLQWKLPLHHHPDSPFHLVNLPSEEIARNIANRSQFSFSQLHSFFILIIATVNFSLALELFFIFILWVCLNF